jgi:uncharacterized coiled-coil DUF342 family protein
MKILNIVWLACLLALFGCGKSDVDTATPVADLEQEAETLSVDELKVKANAYKEMVAAKMQELEPIKEKLMEIPLAEQMGDEAKALQTDIKALQTDLSALQERLQVYLDALKEKGESVKEYMN